MLPIYSYIPDLLVAELDEAGLKRKKALCEEMLRILNILQPGFTARRGGDDIVI